MAEVVDLSTLKKPTDNPQADPDFESLSDEEKARLREMAEQHNVQPPEDEGVPVRTAFLVVVGENGEIFASTDIDTKVKRAYTPNGDDIYGAASVIQRDMSAQLTAQQTVLGMQQYAAAQAQRMQEAQITAQLQKAGLKR